MKKKGIISTILLFLSFSFGVSIGVGTNNPEKEQFAYQQGKISKQVTDITCIVSGWSEEALVVEEYGPVELNEFTIVVENITHNEKCVSNDTGDEELTSIQIEELPVPVVLLEVEQIQSLPETIALT